MTKPTLLNQPFIVGIVPNHHMIVQIYSKDVAHIYIYNTSIHIILITTSLIGQETNPGCYAYFYIMFAP